MDCKRGPDSVGKEALNNNLIDFGVTMSLVRLIITSLNEAYSEVRIGIYLSDSFPIQNILRLHFKFAFEYGIRKVQENQVGYKIGCDTSGSGLYW
jgi:hypothetical protein